MSNIPDKRSLNSSSAHMNLFGRYRLMAKVGRGGMSDVYLAVTEGNDGGPQFQKLLVIKMLTRELCDDSEFVRMFLDEARLAARLNHPNVVQTIEAGESSGRYFLAMEYLEGQPLHRVLRNAHAQAMLTTGMRLYILGHALTGLHYAHERRDYDGSALDIVHRDFSPSNLFVTYDGHVKLMDFGIAKARDSTSETRVGVFKGKAGYISPEQARGDAVDRRADVYSAGVVLWELITGRRLWSGLTQLQTLRRVVSGEVPSPRSVDPRLDPELERMCMKALAFNPEVRYANAAEFARELETFAQRSCPPVSGRDLGNMIARSFTEDRERIRSVVEAQLSNQASPESSLPELTLISDMEKTPVHPSLPDAGEFSGTREARRSAPPPRPRDSFEPMLSSPLIPPPRMGMSRPRRDLLKKVGLVGLGAMLVGGSAAALFGSSEHTPAPPAEFEANPALATERGISDREIKIGMSAVFSGQSRELGQNMKLGVETSFQAANAAGGIHGRMLNLTALDDEYEGTLAATTMKELIEERGVFAIVGNVGTPTSMVAAPFASQHKTIFFGAFTGAPVLRQDPPDRYVFNYRASYKEETASSVRFLLDVKRISPEQIVVFAQEDSYGDAGFEGVAKALRAQGFTETEVLRVGYKRNTIDVDTAVANVLRYNDRIDPAASTPTERVARHPVKAIVMIATYRAAARFIQKIRALPRMQKTLFMNVSFVGSETLAEELAGINPTLCPNVYVTQVVPPFDSGATGVRRYREQLAEFQPQAKPGFVSLEGYIVGSIFVEALRRVGPALTTEKLVDTLEQVDGLDLGFGTKISFSLSEHQGSHKVWGTRLDETCTYNAVDLD